MMCLINYALHRTMFILVSTQLNIMLLMTDDRQTTGWQLETTLPEMK